MSSKQISILHVSALFAVAAAIVFHAWWPGFKADRDLDQYVAVCMAKHDYRASDACIKEYFFLHSADLR